MAWSLRTGFSGKRQARAQLRLRMMVISYAARVLLTAADQPVDGVEKEGIIVVPKKVADGGETDSSESSGSSADDAEAKIYFVEEQL